jgi:hypothetical protein
MTSQFLFRRILHWRGIVSQSAVGEDSDLARERKLDIEAALAEAAEDDDMDM